MYEAMIEKLDLQIAMINAKDEDGLKERRFILQDFNTAQLEQIKDFVESFSTF